MSMKQSKGDSRRRRKHASDHSLSSYRRQSRNLKPRERVLIICPTDETEYLYFSELRLRLRIMAEVKVLKKSTGAVNVVRRAIELAKRAEDDGGAFDQVWCALDVEQQPDNADLKKARKLAKDSGVRLAMSNPAIEYWFLLHFEASSTMLQNAKATIARLRRHLRGYKKNDIQFDRLFENTEAAIANAQQLTKSTPNITQTSLSWTTVHELVRHLVAISRRPWD